MSDKNASPILPANSVLLLAKQALGMLLLCAGCRAAGPSSPGAGEAPSLARYLDLPRATAPSLTPDGRRAAFLSDLPGLPQPYSLELPAPGAPPAGPWAFARLASLPHRTQLVRWLDDGGSTLLGYDRGGNENMQFSVVEAPGGGLRPLTDLPTVRHLFGAIDPDRRRLAYSSNERNGRDFDVMIRDLAGGEARMLHRSQGHLEPRAFSSGGGALLLVEKRSSFDEALHLLSVPPQGAGSLVSLTFNTTPARYQDACFLGPLVLVLSDHEREYLSLTFHNALYPAGPPVTLLTERGDFDVLACSPSGDRFAVALNVDGRHELRIYKVARATDHQQVPIRPFPGQQLPASPPGIFPGPLQALPPEQLLLALHGRSALVMPPAHTLPPGVIRALEFSKDGSTLAVQLGRSTEPDQLWTVQIDSGATAQRTTPGELLEGLPPRVEPELVAVPSFDGLLVPVFLYRPPGAGAGRKVPVVVWVHGGPEGQFQPSFSPMIQALVARGIAVAAPNVRGSTGYGKRYSHLDDVEKREDSVRDLAEVNRWLRGRPEFDGERIAVMGGSYGGYMVLAALTLDPELWAAGVDVVGIANFRTFLERTAPYRRAQREAEYGSLERDGALLDRLSPIHRVDRIRAPLFVIHGANDPRVPVAEAEQIVSALEQRKREVIYLRFDDEGHGLSRRENQLAAYSRVLDFFQKKLQP